MSHHYPTITAIINRGRGSWARTCHRCFQEDWECGEITSVKGVPTEFDAGAKYKTVMLCRDCMGKDPQVILFMRAQK